MMESSHVKGWQLVVVMAIFVLLVSVSGEVGIVMAVGVLGLVGLTLSYSILAQLNNAFVRPARRIYARDFGLKFMATLMGLFLVIGTLLYLYVFHTIESDSKYDVEFSNAELLFRSLICSLDLFMLDVDTNILDRLDSHGMLKGWLSVQAVLSFACTVGMLVGLVYSRLNAYYKLNYLARITHEKNHLYLFFGNNEPTGLLIKDIVKNDPKAVAVIIDEANLNEEDNDEWAGIVGLIAHKQKVFKTAKSVGAHVAIASQQLDDIDDEITERGDFDAFGYLGLSRIRELISRLARTDAPQLHMFFMGEDEELNIRNIIALAKDTTMLSVAKNRGIRHRIYCHARYNGPNRVIEDVALKKHLDIKIIDSSHIAVELLKLDPAYHPVNVVKTSRNNPATVEGKLTVLIVGFGEVGRDAFRFLYEFGAFVDSNDTDKRSPFECVIVDKNIEKQQGVLMASMPAIFGGKNRIKFSNADYNGKRFNVAVLSDDFLDRLNYVVISVGNNDEAIALAARIFDRVRRVRKDVSNLRIFVRCTEDKKVEGIRKIADHYNYGYGEGENNPLAINIFGQPDKTYTYDMVVSDRLIGEARLFHEKYRLLSDEGDSWDDRHKKLTRTGNPDIEKLRKLRRQESQDRANALHAGTKMILFKRAMEQLQGKDSTRIDWYSFYIRYFLADGSANVEGSKEEIRYPGLSDAENRIIRNLAILEHVRWNAAHELMGYLFREDSKGCDERTMEHNCLCPWGKLDNQSDKNADWGCDYKKYDFCVVDTSLALSKDKLLKNQL